MNPILPLDAFVPDGEAHRMPDGRLYLYGSLDVRDGAEYCSPRYRVFSTADMRLWRDEGESFRLDEGLLYAPDCAYKDGRYYLYYCTAGNGEYTAVSDAPGGPFTDPRPLNIADGTGIDPAVLVDDDGAAYYFWGQFSLKGARLNPDMRSIDEGSVTEHILTEETHGFHEGASIRKRNGLYYLVYTDISRGRATCLSYAVSASPLGPYEKGGVIVDNTYCDPGTWNDHGSIEPFGDQWYVFYHRSSRNGIFSRRACCEKIYFDGSGRIGEVEMTSQGAGGPLDAFAWTPAWRACRMRGGPYLASDGEGEKLAGCGGPEAWPSWAEWKYLDFGGGAKGALVMARGRGVVTLRQEDRREGISIPVDSQDWRLYEAAGPLRGGVHPAYMTFAGEGMEVRGFMFR